jgi:hypothetical protein
VGASGERDENVEKQVTQFVRFEAVIGTDFSQYLARLQPILARRSQDRMVSRQTAEEFVFRWSGYAAQQFRKDHRRQANHAVNGFDLLSVAAGANLIHQYGCVEDDDFTHRVRKT